MSQTRIQCKECGYPQAWCTCETKETIKPWIGIILIAAVIYTVYIRFANPELTETQLFLKMIGL